mmetsp:Transcript_181/g.268  ORF Transcript_181/g.268 Transcript_181/m.268 type:complete len:191 (-) Transcript_181:42-614(-)
MRLAPNSARERRSLAKPVASVPLAKPVPAWQLTSRQRAKPFGVRPTDVTRAQNCAGIRWFQDDSVRANQHVTHRRERFLEEQPVPRESSEVQKLFENGSWASPPTWRTTTSSMNHTIDAAAEKHSVMVRRLARAPPEICIIGTAADDLKQPQEQLMTETVDAFMDAFRGTGQARCRARHSSSRRRPLTRQ